MKALDAEVDRLIPLGRYAEAEAELRDALESQLEDLGPTHMDVGWLYNNLGLVCLHQRDYAEAEVLFEQSRIITEFNLGPDHPNTAAILGNIAHIRRDQGDFVSALELYRRSLAIRRAALGPDHRVVGVSLNNIAAVLSAQGDYRGARAGQEESLAITRAALGSDHTETAITLDNLASTLTVLGAYSEAMSRYGESLAIWRRAGESGRLQLATGLNGFGGLLHDLGDYAAARSAYEESLSIQEEILGPDHPLVALSLQSLAGVRRDLGDDDAALALIQRALEIQREVLAPDHPHLSGTLTLYAMLEHRAGDFAAARAHYEESLRIQRSSGGSHPTLASNLNGLARILRVQSDFDEAAALFEEALAIRIETYGPQSPQVTIITNNLATLYWKKGEFERAEALFKAGIEVMREASGPRHPALPVRLDNLAALYRDVGDIDSARPLRDEALGIVEAHADLSGALSEREALAFLSNMRPVLDGWLSDFDRVGDAEAGWGHVLAYKGSVAAQARTARALASTEPEVAAAAAALHEARSELARHAFSDDGELEPAALDALSVERERLERELRVVSARHSTQMAFGEATPDAVCQALPPGGVLVDLLRYYVDHEPNYLAFVQRHSDCVVSRVELGPAAPVDAAARAWLAVLADPLSLSTRVSERGRAVAEMVLKPLSLAAGDSAHWMVVPDGPLAAIPFGALPTDRGYVIEDRLITYLDRANDLLVAPTPTSAGGALIVGGVEYGDPDDSGRLCEQRSFAALPGTVTETAQIAELWRRRRRRSSLTVLSGAEATEASLVHAFRGKSIAHIATHGFFADACHSATSGVGYDPMLFSGLALAGVNQRSLRDEWDGILTAAEVANFDLSGLQLAVLSACETGRGEIESGQGVLGLRRGFAIGGAQNLVMSLWPVSDDATATLMEQFYRRYLRRKPLSAAEALRQAQLEVIEEQRLSGAEQIFAWAAFIASSHVNATPVEDPPKND